MVEQNRDAQLRTLLVNEGDVDPARLVPVLHYDGTPITARFIVACRSPSRIAAATLVLRKRLRNDLSRQAQAPSPRAAEEQARLHAPRLRGRGLDAVRRLRPRLDHAPRSSRPASSSICRRTASPSSPASAARRRRPTYFLGNSHGFNSVHGRMPSVLTGANLANRDLIYLGVSGDGDSASIGLGQFAHCDPPRREHGLHRREQRRVRPDQGAVLGDRRQGLEEQERRGQQRRADRPGRHGAAARRDLRGAQLLRRQGAARAADQGGDRAPGRRLHRRASSPASRSTTTPARPRASTTCASTTRR